MSDLDKDQLPNPPKIDPAIEEEARELAERISRFVNTMSGGRERAKALGLAMLNDHRTLLQTKFVMVHTFINGLAINYTDRYFDARNEQACKLSSQMIEPIEQDPTLPYI